MRLATILIRIGGAQVKMAREISRQETLDAKVDSDTKPDSITSSLSLILASSDATPFGQQGSVQFLELDAETMGDYFSPPTSTPTPPTAPTKFDYIWISEALSHMPSKPIIFREAYALLAPGGKVVIADWFRAEDLSEADIQGDIRVIEGAFRFYP